MMRKLRKIKPIRLGMAIGTAAVIVVGAILLCFAYAGSTFWLGPNTDKPTVVTVVLTFDAVLFAVVTAIVALAAYWKASGEPDLSVEIQFEYSQINEPRFKVLSPNGSRGIPLDPFKQTQGRVVVRNASAYAARNPSVVIKLVGMAVPGYDGPWEVTRYLTTVGCTEFLWDGGADQMVHAYGLRVLPGFDLVKGYILSGQEPEIEITAYADGIKPVRLTLPVITYTEGTPGRPETQS